MRTHTCTYETWRSLAMRERGSAVILASEGRSFDSLINKDITEQGLSGRGWGAGTGVCCCRVFWVMGLQIHKDGEFN